MRKTPNKGVSGIYKKNFLTFLQCASTPQKTAKNSSYKAQKLF